MLYNTSFLKDGTVLLKTLIKNYREDQGLYSPWKPMGCGYNVHFTVI